MNAAAPTSRLCPLLLFLVLLGACDTSKKSDTRTIAASPLEFSTLKNMAYQGFDGLEGPIVLSEGIWEGTPYEEGASSRPQIAFAGDFRLDGDLDGDGTLESAVLLSLSTGGSGTLLYLCVVGRDAEGPVNLATALIGDRVQIRAGRILDNNVILDLVESGPEDPACCPGQLASYGWTFTGAGTLERSTLTAASGRLSLALIENQEWVLRYWDIGEPAPESPRVTLTYAEGRLAGSGGCNRYFTSVVEGTSPGDLRLGPIGSTQMACPDDVTQIEGRFLANLGTVTKFGYHLGRLALTTQSEGRVRTMLFEGP